MCVAFLLPKSPGLHDPHIALTTYIPDFDFAVVLGDLNVNLLTDGADQTKLRTMANSLNLYINNFSPNHHLTPNHISHP